MYNFDDGVNRRGTNCIKWDVPFVTEDILPMWIADMDFQIAPAITENLKKIAEQGAFGYQFLSEKYYEAVMNWMKRRHGYEVKKGRDLFCTQCCCGIIICSTDYFGSRR